MALAISKATNCPGPGWEGSSWPRYSGPRRQLPSRVTTCFDKAQIVSCCPSNHEHRPNNTKTPFPSVSSLDTAVAESSSNGRIVLAQVPAQSTKTRVGDLIFGLVTPTTGFDLLLSCLGSLAPGKQISISPTNFDGRDKLRRLRCEWRLTFLHRLRTLPSTYELAWLPAFFGSYISPKPLAPETEQNRPRTTIRKINSSFIREVFGIETAGLLRQIPIVGLRENLGFAFGFFDAVHVLVAFRTCMSPPAASSPGHSFVLATPTRSNNSRKRKGAQTSSVNDDDDDANSDSSSLVPDPKKTKTNTGNTNAQWACHYCKLDPVAYRSCLSRQHSAPRRVKEHLLRFHLQARHCPTCHDLFKDCKSRDRHIKRRQCEPNEPSPEFKLQINEDKEKQLRGIKGGDAQENWFKIWNILFPGRPEPASPVVTDDDWEALGRLSSIRRTESVFRERLRSVPGLNVEHIMSIWLDVVDHQPLQAGMPATRRTLSAIEPPQDPGPPSNTRSSFSVAGHQSARGSQLTFGSSSTSNSSAAATTVRIPVQPHTNPEAQSSVQPSQISDRIQPTPQASAQVATSMAPQINPGNDDFWRMPDLEFGVGAGNAAFMPNHYGRGFSQSDPNLFGMPAAQDVMDYAIINNNATMFSPFPWMLPQGNFLGSPSLRVGMPTWAATPTGQEIFPRPIHQQQQQQQHHHHHHQSGTASNTPQQSRGQWVQRNRTGRPAAADSHSAGEGPRNQP